MILFRSASHDRRTSALLAFLAGLILFASGALAVLAQTETETATTTEIATTTVTEAVAVPEDAASSQAVSTTTISDLAAAVDTAPPYKIEKIRGDIEAGDYVVGPGKVELVVEPGQSVTAMVMVTNRMSDDRQFELTVEDMSGSADGAENVVLLGDQEGPYSLRDYISFKADSFDLDLGERALVPVTVTMPPNAEPGGYYGAVLVSTVRKDDQPADSLAPRSPIVARIGSLFFITVPGEIEASGSLLDVSTTNDQTWFQSGPIEFGILFENTGSVHLNPHGEVRVTNMLGEEVGYVEIDPWFVLPRSLRLRELSWDRELLFGRYTFTANINRGYDDLSDSASFHVWVLPWKILLGLFAAVLVISLLVRGFLRTFEFKRRRN